jgi:hypothetical protein
MFPSILAVGLSLLLVAADQVVVEQPMSAQVPAAPVLVAVAATPGDADLTPPRDVDASRASGSRN